MRARQTSVGSGPSRSTSYGALDSSLLGAAAGGRALGSIGGFSRAAPSCPDLRSLGQAEAKERNRSPGRSVANREAGLSLSAAKQELFSRGSMRGCLYKRGFRHRRLWISRIFVLQGRMLTYFVDEESRMRDVPRGCLELTTETRFRQVSSGNAAPSALPPFQFEVIPPSGGGPPWLLIAATAVERSAWLTEMTRVVRLVERTETPATLRGTGELWHHFSQKQKIGEGRFGVVRLGHANSDGKRYAVKCINKSKCSAARHVALRNELRVLRRIKVLVGPHPAICTTFEVYESEWLLHIVMELVPGGDLFDHIARAGTLSSRQREGGRRASVSGAASQLQLVLTLHFVRIFSSLLTIYLEV